MFAPPFQQLTTNGNLQTNALILPRAYPEFFLFINSEELSELSKVLFLNNAPVLPQF